MAPASKHRFQATVQHTPAEQEQTLFQSVCDAIGEGAAYVAHDIMPDIHARLIDEAWYGRTPGAEPSHSPEKEAVWPSGSLTIEGEISPSPEHSHSPDLDIER